MIYFFSRGWGSSGIRVFLNRITDFFLLFWFCLMSFWMYLGAFAFLIVGVFCLAIRMVLSSMTYFVFLSFLYADLCCFGYYGFLFFSFLLFFFDLCGFGSYECVCLLQSVGIRSCEFFNFCFCFVVCVESGSVSDF